MFWTKVLVERLPVVLGTSLLLLVVTHPAWMPRAILVTWAVAVVVTLAEHRAYRAHQEFHRQEAAEAERLSREAREAAVRAFQASREKVETYQAELRAEAMEDLAALPRAEWMRLALFLPPDTQQAVILRRAEREEAERERVDPPWTPKAAPPEHPHGPGCRCPAVAQRGYRADPPPLVPPQFSGSEGVGGACGAACIAPYACIVSAACVSCCADANDACELVDGAPRCCHAGVPGCS